MQINLFNIMQIEDVDNNKYNHTSRHPRPELLVRFSLLIILIRSNLIFLSLKQKCNFIGRLLNLTSYQIANSAELLPT